MQTPLSVTPALSNNPSTPLNLAAFRSQLFSRLQSAGVVDSLKTQLRSQLISQLNIPQAFHAGARSVTSSSLSTRIINSLIFDYLRCVPYSYTLSIFEPESGTDEKTVFSRADVVEAFHLSMSSLSAHKSELSGLQGC